MRIAKVLKRAARVGAIGAAIAAATAPARAEVVVDYPNFTGACGSGLTCVGNTAVVGGALRLTPSADSQRGAGYSTTAVGLGANATFSTSFQFHFTQAGGINPADGITFVLAKTATGLGASGGGLGYQGVGDSVAVEFDVFNNGEAGGSNHVAIDRNGVLENLASVSPYGQVFCDFGGGTSYLRQGCMSNGSIWTATLKYDGATQLMDVYLQEAGFASLHLINAYAIDIASLLGSNEAFVGFTSGTGAGYLNHDVLSWRFASDTDLGGGGQVPEPAGVALALLGLGLSWRLRRQG